MHGCKRTYLHAYVHGHRCSQHTHIQTKKKSIHTQLHSYIHMHTCRHTHMQTNIHRIRRHLHTQNIYIYTILHVYLKICIDIHVYICTCRQM